MESFICLNCKYKFKTTSGKIPQACPYCDKRTIQKESSAEDLVSEVESLLQESR